MGSKASRVLYDPNRFIVNELEITKSFLTMSLKGTIGVSELLIQQTRRSSDGINVVRYDKEGLQGE